MQLSYNQEILARFMVKYPVVDMRTMQMVVEGAMSEHPFAKNALTRGVYTVRGMSKMGLICRRSDGFYSLRKAVVDEFPESEPYYKVNGNPKTRKRIADVAWIAAVMYAMGAKIDYLEDEISFACSTVWRKLNPVVSNTSRYVGVLNLPIGRFAVYDVSDTDMEWQREAEESLFTETPKSKNVSLAGAIMLTDKDVCEQTIDITEESLKKSRKKFYKRSNRKVNLNNFAPISVSANFKQALLLSYEDFTVHLTQMRLFKTHRMMFDISYGIGKEFTYLYDSIYDGMVGGKKAFLYLFNDIVKLMKMIAVINSNAAKEVVIIYNYQFEEVIKYFFDGQAVLYELDETFYKERRLDSYGKNSFGSNKRIRTNGASD